MRASHKAYCVTEACTVCRDVSNNPHLVGALPTGLASLQRLRVLCVPTAMSMRAS